MAFLHRSAGKPVDTVFAAKTSVTETQGRAADAKTVSVERDYRIDFFRGLALIFIFIDHVPSNALSYFTLRSFAYSDAAEVFYFMSGYVAALVYGRTLMRNGAMTAARQVYKRVWTLYIAHIVLFMLLIAEVSLSVAKSGDLSYDTDMRVDDFLAQPDIAIVKALTLQFQPVYLDILPLYIVFLALLPFVLAALRVSLFGVLVPSALLYGGVQIWHWNLRSYPQGHTWYFDPFAWQFLFFIGVACGHPALRDHLKKLKAPWLVGLAAIIVAAGMITSFSSVLHGLWPSVPAVLRTPPDADKTILAPIRLVNFLALALIASRVIRPQARFLTGRIAWPIVRCGQHSLYVFCLTILLALAGRVVFQEFGASAMMQAIVNLLGILALIGFSTFITWYRHDGRLPPPPTPGAA